MNRRALLGRLVASFLLPALVVILILMAGREFGLSGQFARDMAPGELIRGTTVGQTFIADATGVYRVDVLLATYARRNSGPIIFHLRSSPADIRDWVTLRIDAARVRDNAFQSFEFKPLPNAKGEPLYFYLEAPEARPGNAITVWANSQDEYAAGQAVALLPLNQHMKDLAFRVYYQSDVRQKFRDVLNGMAADKPGLFGTRAWYLTLGLLHLALLFCLGWLLGVRPDEPTASSVAGGRGDSSAGETTAAEE